MIPIEGPGTYILVIALAQSTSRDVGGLGSVHFPAGHYLYVGSALGGLRARLERHMRPSKRLHWHIDYLLTVAQVIEIWCLQSRERQECAWARALVTAPGVRAFGRRFGASDCACGTHLFYSETRPDLEHCRGALPRGAQMQRIPLV